MTMPTRPWWRAALILGTCYLATIGQGMGAMWAYRHDMSAGSPMGLFGRSLLLELCLFEGPLLMVPVLVLLLVAGRRGWQRTTVATTTVAYLALAWFFAVDCATFADRHAAWSTYASWEIPSIVIRMAWLPLVLAAGVVFALVMLLAPLRAPTLGQGARPDSVIQRTAGQGSAPTVMQ
jgi:hypothetical protein